MKKKKEIAGKILKVRAVFNKFTAC